MYSGANNWRVTAASPARMLYSLPMLSMGIAVMIFLFWLSISDSPAADESEMESAVYTSSATTFSSGSNALIIDQRSPGAYERFSFKFRLS